MRGHPHIWVVMNNHAALGATRQASTSNLEQYLRAKPAEAAIPVRQLLSDPVISNVSPKTVSQCYGLSLKYRLSAPGSNPLTCPSSKSNHARIVIIVAKAYILV
jgi:hypothetical protein